MGEDYRARVERVLREDVAPALKLDGSGLTVLDVSDGVAQVRVGPVCASCPATLHVLVHGLEEELRKRFPEIDYIEASL